MFDQNGVDFKGLFSGELLSVCLCNLELGAVVTQEAHISWQNRFQKAEWFKKKEKKIISVQRKEKLSFAAHNRNNFKEHSKVTFQN